MSHRARVPDDTQLYWVCEHCRKPHPWPERRARKYCNESCRNKAYYRRKKKNMEEIDAADFEGED